MKSKILCLILILASSVILQAQDPLLISKKKTERDQDTQQIVKVTETKYSYNQAGKVTRESFFIDGKETSRQEHTWDKNDNWLSSLHLDFDQAIDALDTTLFITLTYNDFNERSEYNYYTDTYNNNFVSLQSKRIYTYDDNQCLIEIERFTPTQINDQIELELIGYEYFERDEMCNITTKINSGSNYDEKSDYSYDDRGFLIEKSNYNSNGNQGWIFKGKETYENDGQGRPLTVLNLNTSNNVTERTRYEYENTEDDYTLESRETYQVATDTWFELSREEYEITPLGERKRTLDQSSSINSNSGEVTTYFEKSDYSYDSSGYLTERNFERLTVEGNQVLQSLNLKSVYTNRCDGIVKTENSILLSAPIGGLTGNPTNTVFTYAPPAECEAPKESYNISLSPNPATENYITLSSDLLYVPGTTVKLYSSNGQLLREFVSEISEQKSLDLAHLSSGIYALILENKNLETFLTEKFVIGN